MTSPYAVPVSSLSARAQEATAEGPSEPTGVVLAPVPATGAARPGSGPLDPALPVNAIAVHGT